MLNSAASGDRAASTASGQEASTSTTTSTSTPPPVPTSTAVTMDGQLSSLHAGDRAELLPKPKPYDLEQRIKKIISLNTAIVEHNDPFWAKKLMNQRHHSTSSLPSPRGLIHHQSSSSSTANILNPHPILQQHPQQQYNNDHTIPNIVINNNNNNTNNNNTTTTSTTTNNNTTTTGTTTTISSSNIIINNSNSNHQSIVCSNSNSSSAIPFAKGNINNNNNNSISSITKSHFEHSHSFEPSRRRYSEVSFIDRSQVGSRLLQSALMGKCPPVTSQATTVITSRKLSQGLPHFDHHESVIKNGKAIMQAANGEGDLKGSLVRNLLTSKVSLAMKTPHKANVSDSNASEHERSVIKDLLLKPRDSSSSGELWRSSPKSPTSVPGTGVGSGGPNGLNGPPHAHAAHPHSSSTSTSPSASASTLSSSSSTSSHPHPPNCHSSTNGASSGVTEKTVSSHSEHELSPLYYVCTICKIAFRTKDNLEAHALHYCKSHHQPFASHNFDHNSEVQRKVSVMQNSSSVLQRRLTEGRQSSHLAAAAAAAAAACNNINNNININGAGSDSVHRNPLGNILKKTLEDPKRKISEPVLPSRFAINEMRMGPRKHSILHNSHYVQSPLSKPIQSTTFSTTTSATTAITSVPNINPVASLVVGTGTGINESGEDSFTKQVSAMLERKLSRDRSALPPLHDLTLESNSSSSSCISVPSTRSTCSTNSTIVLVPFAGKAIVEASASASSTGSTSPPLKVPAGGLDILPDYLPILKPSQTKITVIGPLLFPVLEKKIISEDKDLVEFQVMYPSEIGVNGLFGVNTISSGNKGDSSIELTKLTNSSSSSGNISSNFNSNCNSSTLPVMQVTSMPCREEMAMETTEAVAMDEPVAMEEEVSKCNSYNTTTDGSSNGNGNVNAKGEEEKDEKENLNENSSHNREATSGFDGNSTCNSLNMENNNNNNSSSSSGSCTVVTACGSSSSCNGLEKKVTMQVGKDSSVDQREIGADQPECKESPRTRPSSLALRPTAFGQLIRSNILSPETPRLHKKFTQLFHNGHAYTYIGLKVSTRSTYCCIYRPQPMFVAQETEPRLSMYSNWQPSKPHDSLLQEITPRSLLSAYDMKQSTHGYVSSPLTSRMQVTSSQYWLTRSKALAEEEESRKRKFPVTGLHPGEDTSRKISNCEDASDNTVDNGSRKISEDRTSTTSFDSTDSFDHQPKRVKIFEGGFKSNESYTYIRGRGRGKYICEECGIRCKKPSMLKKHIRTHTDLRPYSCRHCAFAFKTKGNLTKHMKSKAHHKKCIELGIVPVPTAIDDSQIDTEALAKQEALERSYSGGNLMSDDDDNENEEDEDGEEENDSDDEGVPIPLVAGSPEKALRKISCESSSDVISRRPSVVVNANEEQEVAQSLLFLSGSWTDSTRASHKVEDTPSTTKRKVSILESTLATTQAASLWNHSYFSRPRSFSFNDIPLRSNISTNSSTNNGIININNNNNSSSITSNNLSGNGNPIISTGTGGMGTPCKSTLVSAVPCIIQQQQQSKQQQIPLQQQQVIISTNLNGSNSNSNNKSSSSNTNGTGTVSNATVFLTSNNGSHLHNTNDCFKVEEKPVAPKVIVTTATVAAQVKCNTASESERDATPDNLMIAEPEATVASHEDSLSSGDDARVHRIEKCSGILTSPTDDPMNGSHIANGTTQIDESEDEPMDLSKRQQQQQAASGEEADEMDDEEMPMMLETPNSMIGHLVGPRREEGEFGSCPVPLASGSEDGEGKCICTICNKTFSRPSQLRLHLNIHYIERPYRCESCAVSFRTKGHLQKHKRSVSHFNKVNMNKTFGTPSNDNPRPFKCSDCKVAFRIHGHLAKHLRSKLHIMRLECLNKLPFGLYAEMERSGVNLNQIDTSDCDLSLLSLQEISRKLSSQSGSNLDLGTMNFIEAESITDEDDEASREGGPVCSSSLTSEAPGDSKRVKSEEPTVERTTLESLASASGGVTVSVTAATPSPAPISVLRSPFSTNGDPLSRERSQSFSGLRVGHAAVGPSLVPVFNMDHFSAKAAPSETETSNASSNICPHPLSYGLLVTSPKSSNINNINSNINTNITNNNHSININNNIISNKKDIAQVTCSSNCNSNNNSSNNNSCSTSSSSSSAPSQASIATRSNTCHLCGQVFKSAKFLQVHLYSGECDKTS